MGLLARQRHREILGRLRHAGGARVTELAANLRVTEETIRRDLEKLSGEGKLLRTHGGAVSLPGDRGDLPFDVRQAAYLHEKRAIAARAVRHVAEGDVLGLDASSTTHELARIIPDIPLTVVTNSLPVAMTLLGRARVRVVCTGGILDPRSRSLTGSLTEHSLGKLHITKFFFSAEGVDLLRGLSDPTDEQAHVKRHMLDVADRTCLLVDHTKFGVKSAVFFANIDEVDLLIADAGVGKAVLDEVAELGLEIEIAE
jgi:DeoR/GlpR family transcriptional regulator of sugar metabolism